MVDICLCLYRSGETNEDNASNNDPALSAEHTDSYDPEYVISQQYDICLLHFEFAFICLAATNNFTIGHFQSQNLAIQLITKTQHL